MNGINLYSNGSTKNHGCEAIYLSLMNILNDEEICIYTENYSDDRKVMPNCVHLINVYETSNSFIDTLRYKIKYKFLKNDQIYFDYLYKPFFKNLKKTNEVFLSVGGDNYCYGYNFWLNSLNEYILKKKNKIVLTGCSIEPSSLDNEMINMLNKFSHIVCRESISYNALKEKNINNLSLLPDPAFILPKDELRLTDEFYLSEIIGINLSPLIFEYSNKDIVLKNIYILMDNILQKTTYNIMLIPHVMIDGNDDRHILNEIYDHYKDERIKIIQSYNATEIKGYISKCKIMVAARTHASIAAYSQCIPTLVLGYSVKSKGIAKDLYGTYTNYVLSVKKIQNEYELLNHFLFIEKNYINIKQHLIKIMPNYKAKCYDIRNIIEEIRNV